MANTRAILFMTAAMATFAATDALIKKAAGTIGAMQCLFLTSILSLAVFLPLLWRKGERLLSRRALSKPMLVRTFGEIIGSSGVVTSLALLPLSLVSGIIQAQPLALTAAAAFILGEKVGWRRWSAVAFGFLGMLIILRPGGETFDLTLLLPLLGVLGLTARDIGTRMLPGDVSTIFATSWAFVSVSCVGFAGTWISGGWREMDAATWAVVCGAAATVSVAYWSITVALRTGEISAVAPFRYTRIIFALAIAWLFFEERPDLAVWIGLGIIITSGLYTFWRERQRENVSA